DQIDVVGQAVGVGEVEDPGRGRVQLLVSPGRFGHADAAGVDSGVEQPGRGDDPLELPGIGQVELDRPVVGVDLQVAVDVGGRAAADVADGVGDGAQRVQDLSLLDRMHR